MKDLNWDHLRYFLAVTRRGSVSGAARELDTSVPTVSRRIQQLEKSLGTRLIERGPAHHELSEAGRALAAYAEQVEATMLQAEDRLRGVAADATGTLRVACAEVVAHAVVLPGLGAFHRAHPGLRIELLIGPRNVSLGHREADVGIRLSRPQEGNYTVRKIGSAGFAWYEQRGASERGDRAAPTVGWDRHLDAPGPPAAAPATARTSLPMPITIDTATGHQLAARHGLGPCLLACAVGDRDPELERCPPGEIAHQRSIWLVTRRAVAGTVRARTFSEFVADACRRDGDQLAGRR